MKLDYSLHSHTYRCGHAEGDIEDYIQVAIKNHFKIYGVSDHVFLPGITQNGTRGDISYLQDYIDKFNASKKLHKDEIKMYLGFESEYSEVFIDYYKYLLKEKGFDYLICGQHCGFNLDKSIYHYFNTLESFEIYKEDVIKAMESGLFLYIAHPDLFFLSCEEVTPLHKKITQEIISAAVKYDMPLEINVHGTLRNRHRNGKIYLDYPCEYFWKEVSKTNIKVVLGGDFHSKDEIGNIESDIRVNNLIKKCQITLSNIEDIYTAYRNRIKKQLSIKILNCADKI